MWLPHVKVMPNCRSQRPLQASGVGRVLNSCIVCLLLVPSLQSYSRAGGRLQ